MTTDNKNNGSIFAWAKKLWPIITISAVLLSGLGYSARLWADQYYISKEAVATFEVKVENRYVSKEVFETTIKGFDKKLDMMIALLKRR